MRVERNLNSPLFIKPEGEGATASIVIKEDENFQKVLYRVEARDADRRVRTHQFITLLLELEIHISHSFLISDASTQLAHRNKNAPTTDESFAGTNQLAATGNCFCGE